MPPLLLAADATRPSTDAATTATDVANRDSTANRATANNNTTK